MYDYAGGYIGYQYSCYTVYEMEEIPNYLAKELIKLIESLNLSVDDFDLTNLEITYSDEHHEYISILGNKLDTIKGETGETPTYLTTDEWFADKIIQQAIIETLTKMSQ